MVPDTEAGSGSKRIPWENYVADARDLFLATSSAGPVAMQVWTTAWCNWATSAAKTHDQLARRWNSIIQDPSQGATVLDKMREDVKQYILEIGGIPEHAVLEFLQTMTERGSIGAEVRSADKAFVDTADDVVIALTDAFIQVAAASEAPGAARGEAAMTTGIPGPAATPAAAPDPLARARQELSRLKTARTRLGKSSEPPAR
jgi:hypothetical protein